MKLFSQGKEQFLKEDEGRTWLELEEVEAGKAAGAGAGPSSSNAGSSGYSLRDPREERIEHVRTTFVEEPPRNSLHPWYRPTCSAGWVIPVMFFAVVLASVAVADMVFDDYYTDLIVALVASGAFFLLVAFYYVGRYLDTRYSADSPTCNLLWRYVFFPVGCMRANAINLVDSASLPPSHWQDRNGDPVVRPQKKSKD